MEDLRKTLDIDPNHGQAAEDIDACKRLSRLNPQTPNNIAKSMSRALLHNNTEKRRLSGIRGGFVLATRCVIDAVGQMFGRQWYADDDYEYY